MALKIKRKFIEDAAIDGLKLKLTTGQAVKLLKSDGTTEVRLIELDESTGKIKLGGAVAALKSDVDSEAALRQAGDAAISSEIQTLVGSEAGTRLANDNALSDRIDVLQGSASQAGSVAKALQDAKDYTDAEVSAEATARQNADSDLEDRLDVVQGLESQAGSIAKALKDAKDYTDAEISEEATARQNADSDLEDRLDVVQGLESQAGSIAKALKDAKDYTDLEIAAEESRAMQAESDLEDRLDVVQGPDSQAGSIAKALKDAKDYTDSEIAAEESRAMQAESDLEDRLDIVQGPDSQAGSIAKALKDAKDYVNDVVGVSSAAVAAFASLSAQMVDGDAATGVINALGSLDERLDVVQGLESQAGSIAKALKDAKDYTDAEISEEATARQNADSDLEDRLDVVQGSDTQAGSIAKALKDAKDYTDSEISEEATARQNAVSDLQSELDDTQAGAGLGTDGSYSAPVSSNYLASASSLKDADSKLDTAIKGVQDQIDAISGGGSGSLGSINSELDATQVGAGLGTDGSYSAPVSSNYLASASSLKDADSKLDAAIKAEKDRAEGQEASIRSEFAAADSDLEDRLDVVQGPDTQAGSIAKALKDAKDYTDSEIAAEESRAMQAESDLEDRLDVIQGLESQAGSIAKALKDAKDYTDSEISEEATARQNADSDLEDRLDVVQGPDTQAGSIAKALKDAKDYVNDVVGVSSTAVAAFASLSAQMVDNDAATGVINALGSLDERLDVVQGLESQAGSIAKALKDAKDYTDAEVSALETALDSRLDVLEANVHKKEKFVIDATHISNGYVDLEFVAMENSIVAAVGRLMIHEGSGEDFTVSTVSGKSRITFVGNLVSSSAEQLAEGDILYVKYVKA